MAGAALLAGAVGMGVAAFMDPALIASPMFDKIWLGLVMNGVSMEAGAIASALTSNRGMAITTRQTAACRQIIYGQQRVGGVMIFKSTTGSHKNQLNYVIVLAGHECDSIQNLYLDGRQVHWTVGSPGNTTRNGVNFGGNADSGFYTGPDGNTYNFGNNVYCEARFGDQLEGDVIPALTANDPTWIASGGNSPWVGGCCYVYLKLETSADQFPTEPEIRFTVNGKNNIFDPRTGLTGFSQNWALIAADVIVDPVYGLGDNSVNQAQLIAAANVCDEMVPLGVAPGNLTEFRYTTNYHYDTSTAPGDVLATMLPGAGGRLSRIGGEWFLWPAYWQGPSFTFDDNDITSSIQWKPYRSVRDLINRVNGTYVAPTYPYNVAGNLYDQNGFYFGSLQNNFPFAFQPTNYPQYAADALHGFPADEWLNEDGGILHPKELALSTVLSVSQAQRLAKIELLRNRQQGSGSFDMSLKAFAMQPTDVMSVNFSAVGWAGKNLEVTGVSFKVDTQGDEGAPRITCTMSVIETDSSVYEWSTREELTVYDVPTSPQQASAVPAAPTNMSLLSGAGTALVGLDGSVTPRIEVQWDTPFDIQTKQIQIQYQEVGASVWLTSPSVDVNLNLAFITGIVAGQAYNVRIRSLRPNGVFSDWTEIDGFTASITLPTTFGIDPIAAGILIGEAPSAGNAEIIVPTFTAKLGTVSVVCLPFGEFIISGLLENTLYYVYYVDPNFVGGSIVPIATTNTADFVGKVGFYLIDAIRTPGFIAGSGNFSPANFNDLGNSGTQNPSFAADSVLGSVAIVTARTPVTGGTAGTMGVGQWLGFPNTALSYDTQLKVTATISTIDNAPCSIVASIGGVNTTLVSSSVSLAQTTYFVPVSRNTNLSTISLTVTANGGGGTSSSTAQAIKVSVAEIFIPYVGNTGQPGSDTTGLQPIVLTGLSNNLIPNGNFILGDITGWAPTFGASSGGTFGNGGMQIGSNSAVQSHTFNVIPGQKYRLSFTGRVTGAGTQSVFHRIFYSPTYSPNTQNAAGIPFVDFMTAGSITSTFVTYTYDWLCPAGANFASLAMYELGTAPLLYAVVSAQDYSGVNQWGADPTSLNIPTELLVNGSFEQGFTGWTYTGGTVDLDTTLSKYGTQSVSIHGGGITQAAQVPLTAGHTYTAQAWVKTNGSVVGHSSLGSGLCLIDPSRFVTVQKTNGTAVNAGGTTPGVVLAATAAADWTQIQFTFKVSTNCSLSFNLNDAYGAVTTLNGTAWFDGVSLIDITGGADVTGSNTAMDTVFVNGVPSGSISPIAGLMPVETGADKTLNHVLTTSIAQEILDPTLNFVQLRTAAGVSGAPIPQAYTVAEFSVVSNDPSDVFNLQACIQWNTNALSYVNEIPCTPGGSTQMLGYVDAPRVAGTAPFYGAPQPSTSAFQTFGFGAGYTNCSFFGTATGLSVGSHLISLVFLTYSQSFNATLHYAYSQLQQISS